MCSRAHALQQEKPLQREAHTLQLESRCRSQQLEEANEQPWRSSETNLKKKKWVCIAGLIWWVTLALGLLADLDKLSWMCSGKSETIYLQTSYFSLLFFNIFIVMGSLHFLNFSPFLFLTCIPCNHSLICLILSLHMFLRGTLQRALPIAIWENRQDNKKLARPQLVMF